MRRSASAAPIPFHPPPPLLEQRQRRQRQLLHPTRAEQKKAARMGSDSSSFPRNKEGKGRVSGVSGVSHHVMYTTFVTIYMCPNCCNFHANTSIEPISVYAPSVLCWMVLIASHLPIIFHPPRSCSGLFDRKSNFAFSAITTTVFNY